MITSAIVEEPSLNFTVPSSYVLITYNVNIQPCYAHQQKQSMYHAHHMNRMHHIINEQ
jgi:hypothetical protein